MLIIPISKLLGNYNSNESVTDAVELYQYLKLLGNYNKPGHTVPRGAIISISKFIRNPSLVMSADWPTTHSTRYYAK